MVFRPRISILTSLYRSEAYLASFLEEVSAQSLFSESEIVFVSNEGSREEKELLAEFQGRHPQQVKLMGVEPVETLGASWNRAWRSAAAPYLAIWNVDDRRFPDSLERQVLAMETHPDWVLCYGDYLLAAQYGDEIGQRRHTPPYSPRYFRRAEPQGGAFWVLRGDIHGQLGYFDEQLHVGPDFEYSARIAEAGLRMGRVDGLLGTFTDAEQGLSTRDGAQDSAVDRTAIQLRYGAFDKVRTEYVEAARRYRRDEVLNAGRWKGIEDFLPGHKRRLKARRPLWLLGKVRNALRVALARMGLLDRLYGWQRRYLKRDL